MNVYQLYIEGKRRPVYHAEHPEDTTPRDERGRPVRSRLERSWRNLRAILKRAVRKGGPNVGRLWNWLNRRPPPDEPLLQGLRHADGVTVFFPTTINDAEARRLWNRYLARRWRRHLITFAWDLAISPLIALLMVLPGPNVVGYWFLYRIVTHLLAMRGVLWARLGWIPFRFQPHPALCERLDLEDTKRAVQVAERLDLVDLDDFLRRLADYRRGKLELAQKSQEPAKHPAGVGQRVPQINAPSHEPPEDAETPHDAADSVF